MHDLSKCLSDKKIDVGAMEKAFMEIQMPRTKYQLEAMVVNGEDTPQQAYAHCVLELQIKWDDLRIAQASAELMKLEIKELPNDEKGNLQRRIKEVGLEQLDRTMTGALLEFMALYEIWQKFPVKYTRGDLNAAQPEYWMKRLTRQASQDLRATGRVGQGNQEALRQIGIGPDLVPLKPELPAVAAKPALLVVAAAPKVPAAPVAPTVVVSTPRPSSLPNDPAKVQERFLAGGKCRVLICVATEKPAFNGIPVLDGVVFPTEAQQKIVNQHSQKVADAYNSAAIQALSEDADWLFTVEDDTFPPSDAFVRLLDLATEHADQPGWTPDRAVGAWYPKRCPVRQGVHIAMRGGRRISLPDDGAIHEVYTLAMGCTLFPTAMFKIIQHPWFITTSVLSQDSYFSQLAREAGFKLLCDTSIKCRHIDRVTGEVFV